jgi:hypothetical protein
MLRHRCRVNRTTKTHDAVRLARATGRTNHLDYMENKTEKTWHKTKLPEDLDEGYRLAQARMLMLAVRVRDDTIDRLSQRAPPVLPAIGILYLARLAPFRHFGGASAQSP